MPIIPLDNFAILCTVFYWEEHTLMKHLSSGADILGLHLSAGQLEQFEVYYRQLADWNRRINLTTITGYEEVQVSHFLDALTVALVWWPPTSGRRPTVIDVGAGAGIPGVPLRIAFPEVRLVLLESTRKKAAFLRHLCQYLGLDDVEILVGRAEEVAHSEQYREKFDLALSRAVALLPALVELALPFCAVGGMFVAHKKGDIEREVGRASAAIDKLGGRLQGIRAVDLPEFADRRYLVLIEKVTATPERYPRRPGIPAKRPLL